jgi:hypothetical protein
MEFLGPACDVLLKDISRATLDTIDDVLARVSDQIARTRKGLVWDIWIGGRPVHLSVISPPPTIVLSAGCNLAEDYAKLKWLAIELATALGGSASEPTK